VKGVGTISPRARNGAHPFLELQDKTEPSRKSSTGKKGKEGLKDAMPRVSYFQSKEGIKPSKRPTSIGKESELEGGEEWRIWSPLSKHEC